MDTIFWDEMTGTVYWVEKGEMMFAPMNDDNTCDLRSGGSVDLDVCSPAEQARIKTALHV